MSAVQAIAEAYDFICSRCKKPSRTAFMCEACFNATDPAKQRDSSRAWYEPKTRRSEQRRERIEQKKGRAWSKAFDAIASVQPDLSPGWTQRLMEVVARDDDYQERMEWLDKHWQRTGEVLVWRRQLSEQDATRLWANERREEEKAGYGRVSDADYVENSDNRFSRLFVDTHSFDFEKLSTENARPVFGNHLQGVPSNIVHFDPIETEAGRREMSRDTFFNKIVALDLTEDEYATLCIRVHQMRVIREYRSEKAYTSNDAAVLLSKKLSEHITPSAYRKRVERLEVKLPFDLQIWVDTCYL